MPYSLSHVRAELEELHAGLVTWMNGRCPGDTKTFERLLGCRFGTFSIITPSGRKLDKREILGAIRNSHGSNPSFEIAITDVAIVHETDEAVVATCIEWQRNAQQTTPPDNARYLTVVFSRDENCPHGLRWLHLHETMLSAENVAAHSGEA